MNAAAVSISQPILPIPALGEVPKQMDAWVIRSARRWTRRIPARARCSSS
jgi:hypothetical protein